MDTVRTLLVDAFTDEPLTGNPAGVVLDAAGFGEERMQGVARELSVSETAFLLPGGSADHRIRYFTPTREVDLCGHATIGTFAGLLALDRIDPGIHDLETNVGVLQIEVTDDGTVWMTQDRPSIRREDLDLERVADALGLPPSSIAEVDLPIAVASTGLPWLMVPVSFLAELGNADPDLGAVETLCEVVDAVGVYAFTFDTLDADATLHARAFAPGAGVPEDPVTGTASGAAGAYLRHVGAFDGDLPEEMTFEQGHFLERPGHVGVRVAAEVQVGGKSAVALDGELSVPERDEDGIIEA